MKLKKEKIILGVLVILIILSLLGRKKTKAPEEVGIVYADAPGGNKIPIAVKGVSGSVKKKESGCLCNGQ